MRHNETHSLELEHVLRQSIHLADVKSSQINADKLLISRLRAQVPLPLHQLLIMLGWAASPSLLVILLNMKSRSKWVSWNTTYDRTSMAGFKRTLHVNNVEMVALHQIFTACRKRVYQGLMTVPLRPEQLKNNTTHCNKIHTSVLEYCRVSRRLRWPVANICQTPEAMILI